MGLRQRLGKLADFSGRYAGRIEQACPLGGFAAGQCLADLVLQGFAMRDPRAAILETWIGDQVLAADDAAQPFELVLADRAQGEMPRGGRKVSAVGDML